MSVQAVLLPLFVQVALTFALMFWMAAMRVGDVRRGEARIRDTALGEPNWPTRTQQIGNCFNNQFQLPVLFYVLVALALITHKADLLFVLLSWVFVILRIVHAAIHTTSNRVSQRFMVFAACSIVLLVMWVIFAIRILLAL